MAAPDAFNPCTFFMPLFLRSMMAHQKSRARAVLAADKLPAMIMATVFLAVAADFYELLCAAGFPMAYARILTLGEPSPVARYFYLVLYNLGEREGRLLKLLSGTMMLEPGVLLLVAPGWPNRPGVALALLAVAFAVTWLAARLTPSRRD